MRCKSCNYALWHLTTRQCPECGTPFKPSDFEFIPNSVRFCCPHCQQTYYGTSEKGHLVPASFQCVACAAPIEMDQMVLLPAEGVAEIQTQAAFNPWVERRTRTLVGAWFRTVGMAISSPATLARVTPPSSSAARAFAFGYITLTLYSIAGAVWILALLSGVAAAGRAAGAGYGLIIGAIGAFVLCGVLLAVLILIVHGSLRITGRRPGEGLRGTVKAVCYSSAVTIPMAVPCLSAYIGWLGWIWWAIVAGFMLAIIQRVRGWRAAFAVSAPVVLTVIISLGLIGLLVRTAASAASASTAAGIPIPARTSMLTSALLSHPVPAGSALALPRHPAEALGSAPGSAPALCLFDGSTINLTRLQNTTIGAMPISQFDAATPNQRATAVAAAASALPAQTTALRIGDVAFTYFGINLSLINAGDGAGKLWLFVDWPAGATAAAPPGRNLEIGLADGTNLSIAPSTFSVLLARQNALRARCSLPPLPHPETLAENQFATAPTPPVMSRIVPDPAAATPPVDTPPIEIPSQPER